jgi:hypothetical protein
VSTPNKPDPARGWQFVQKLLDEEEIARIEKLSDEEIDTELRAHGRDPARLPNAEELLAKAEARAAVTALRARVVPLTPRKRMPWVVWMAAAIVGALVLALLATNSAAIVALFRGTDEIRRDDLGPPRREGARQRALTLRDEAERACRGKLWGTCEEKLDEAMKLDPAGESEARVWNMRSAIAESWQRDAAPDPKKRP